MFVSPENLKLLFITDSLKDLRAHIKKYSIKKFGLKKDPCKSKWLFGKKNSYHQQERNIVAIIKKSLYNRLERLKRFITLDNKLHCVNLRQRNLILYQNAT